MSERSDDPLVILIDDDAAVREALGDLLNSVDIDRRTLCKSPAPGIDMVIENKPAHCARSDEEIGEIVESPRGAGAEPTRGIGLLRTLDLAKANRIAIEQMRRFGTTRVIDGDQLVGTMSGGEGQLLAIGRAMYFGARVLILDEPTSALGVKEAAIILKLMKQARADGVGIIFITHNARHAMAVGDDFTVLIQGRVAAEFRRGEKSREEVLNLMAGGEQMAALEVDLDAID